MTRNDALGRRAFLASAAGAGASMAFGNFSRLFDGLALGDGSITGAWPQARTFEIVALGDSIMWGQGLSDDPAKNQKFTFKVQRFVQQMLPGTEVHLHNFAHSGAQILANENEDARPADYGEIPNYFPSINWQLGRAVAELTGREQRRRYVPPTHPATSPQSVGLVLLDGGINDLGTKKLLTPDPTILENPLDPASGAEWIRRATREQCVDRMRRLLSRVLTTFPNARVVITNYYPVASKKSDPVYLWELLRVWEVIGPALEFSQEWMMQKLAAQSHAFHDELTKGLRAVVADAPPLEVVAKGASPDRSGTDARIELSARTALPRRVALADVGFGAANAYAAPETNLFYLNEPDPAASARRAACMERYGVLNPMCTLAAGGHPNVKGAMIYAAAIIDALKGLFPEWSASRIDPRTRALPGVQRPPV